jgi:hypothetical protein
MDFRFIKMAVFSGFFSAFPKKNRGLSVPIPEPEFHAKKWFWDEADGEHTG